MPKKLERGFFYKPSTEEFEATSELLEQGVIGRASLEGAQMRSMSSARCSLNFFHSPMRQGDDGLELLSVDWKF